MKVGPHLSPYTPFPPATGPKGAERIRREMGTVAPFSHALFGLLAVGSVPSQCMIIEKQDIMTHEGTFPSLHVREN